MRERGQITVMTIGFFVVLGLLAVVVINASHAFLERSELDHLADGAALAAADGLDEQYFYETGEVRADASQARQLVARYVTEPEVKIVSVQLVDGRVTVRLERRIDLALVPPGMPSSTTVVAEATSQLRVGE